MSRLKDRDRPGEPGVPIRLRLGRVGRIRQGIMAKNQQGVPYPLAVPYFIIDPSTTIPTEREQVLTDVREAIETYAPGQDLEKPTVLPICFLINDDSMIAPESYKLRRGKKGTVWCAGDGESIQWKLDDQFRVEIKNAANTKTGEVIHCPGGQDKGRHPWCEECNAELELNFAIQGYLRSGVWMIRTKSMNMRDQLWPQLGIARGFVQYGVVPSLADVPFLLRRQKESVSAPAGPNQGITTVEMPITSIEIEPSFLKWAKARKERMILGAGDATYIGLAPPEGWGEDDEGYLDQDVVDVEATVVQEPPPEPEPDPQPEPKRRKPVPRKETPKPQPEQAPAEDGHTSPEPAPITKPEELLSAVNNATIGKYNTAGEMLKALRRIMGDPALNWPLGDNEFYAGAYVLLVDDAQAGKEPA